MVSLWRCPLPRRSSGGNIPLVGVLEPNPPPSGCFAAFQQGLRDLGYVEGQNITFAYRYAAHQFDRLPTLAAELVQLTPDVIWMHSNAAALAAKQAITTIPVVNAITQEILELGVVESLARPGGNLTGLDVRVFELMGKRLELLKDAVPTMARVAVLVDPANPIYKEVPHNIARETQALGVQLQRVEVGGPETFEEALAALVQGGPTRSCSQRARHLARTSRSSWSWRTGTGCRPCVARRTMPRRGAC